MQFTYGFLIGCVFSIFVGMILFNWYQQRLHNGAGGPDTPYRNILLTPPFLGLTIFTGACLLVAVITEVTFFDSAKDLADGSVNKLISFLENKKTWLSFAKELFFAGFIAMIIIVVVEVSSSQEQKELVEDFMAQQRKLLEDSQEFVRQVQDDTKKRVFEDIYKSAIHPQIFDEVRETIFEAHFVREAHYRSMVLEPIPDRPDKVLLKVSQEYVVCNVTQSPKTSNQQFFIPNPSGQYPDHNRIEQMTVTSLVGENDIPAELTESYSGDPAGVPTVEEREAEVCYRYPAIKLDANGKVRIRLVMQLLKDRSDNEILTVLSPTLKGNFSVQCNVDGLEVKAITLHRGALVETQDGADNFKRWLFNRPMLPYQGYVVMWSEKNR